MTQHTKMHDDWQLAYAAYKAVQAYFEALPMEHPDDAAACGRWCDAMDHLIERVPAPDGESLAIKIELAGSREIHLPDGWIAALAADARRLHAEAS